MRNAEPPEPDRGVTSSHLDPDDAYRAIVGRVMARRREVKSEDDIGRIAVEILNATPFGELHAFAFRVLVDMVHFAQPDPPHDL